MPTDQGLRRDRFERAEPYVLRPEGSGVRARPDVELLALSKAHRTTLKPEERNAGLTATFERGDWSKP